MTPSCQYSIGTQRSIVDKILGKKGHYFLVVKDNQPAFKAAVEDAFLFIRPLDCASQMDGGHGRIETRDCRIMPADAIEDEYVLSRWSGLNHCRDSLYRGLWRPYFRHEKILHQR